MSRPIPFMGRCLIVTQVIDQLVPTDYIIQNSIYPRKDQSMRRVFLALLMTFTFLTGTGRAGVWNEPMPNVYWGDFHVHTQFSFDAYIMGMSQGRYAREAGQYALYCSKLDFYSVTDHSEMLTERDYWPEAIAAAQAVNAIGASRKDSRGDPSIVAFTGWEWTQQGPWGHKNVIMKWDDPKKLPPSPIRSLPGAFLQKGAVNKHGHIQLLNGITVFDLLRGIRYGRRDETFLAYRPKDLYDKLHKYCYDTGSGCDAVVIPHGNAWGVAPQMYTSWDVQLNAQQHDPNIQTLIEVYSKHGNSEEYRDFPPDYRYFRNGVEATEDECSVPGKLGLIIGTGGKMFFSNPDTAPKTFRIPKAGCDKVCQEPTKSYMPCCWRAGEIVRERCMNPESNFCKAQIMLARSAVKPFAKGVRKSDLSEIKPEFRDDPGKLDTPDWQTCGQCRDCYQPAFNYVTNGSVQKALASAYFDPDGTPHYYHFGFIGSTDTHSGLPGSVKETKRYVEVQTGVAAKTNQGSGDTPGLERVVNFLNPGSLVAIISPHRTRDDLWSAVKARHVYSTSGSRIELWAKAELARKGAAAVVDMGTDASSSKNPTFYIRANGSFAEDQTCPYDKEPNISSHLSREEFAHVCLNQCFRVTDKRLKIARIEVVKILQPLTPEEAKMKKLIKSPDNPKGLIMDPYYVENISATAIDWTWTDTKFTEEPKGRSVVYYFRIIQEPTEGYNCNPAYLLEPKRTTCRALNPDSLEVAKKSNPQNGVAPVPLSSIPDACYTDPKDPKTFCEERAWTSPFYIIRE